jgi:chromosome segregation ATPase
MNSLESQIVEEMGEQVRKGLNAERAELDQVRAALDAHAAEVSQRELDIRAREEALALKNAEASLTMEAIRVQARELSEKQAALAEMQQKIDKAMAAVTARAETAARSADMAKRLQEEANEARLVAQADISSASIERENVRRESKAIDKKWAELRGAIDKLEAEKRAMKKLREQVQSAVESVRTREGQIANRERDVGVKERSIQRQNAENEKQLIAIKDAQRHLETSIAGGGLRQHANNAQVVGRLHA